MGTHRLTIVLGIAGGIAAYKAPQVLRLLTEAGHDVRAIPTPSALQFIGAATLEALSHHPVTTSVFDNVDQVEHVRLGQTADLLIIAPATADLIARLAQGRADDLLTASVLVATCPIVVVPAMHTEMWFNPATQDNVATLRRRGITVMEPDVGRLTGADTGPGRLPEPQAIVDIALLCAQRRGPLPRDLEGATVLISAGGTQEALDPVRYLGNHSSGRQGFALAAVAVQRGATVHLIAAPSAVATPPAVERTDITSAAQLHAAMRERQAEADVVIMAAAVADFRPAHQAAAKLKKGTDSEPSTVELVRNPDILADLVAQRREQGYSQVIVGFAAETGDETTDALTYGARKLASKGCDIVLVNEVGEGKVFGQAVNAGWLVRASGTTAVPEGSKFAVAATILDAVVAQRAEGA